MSGRERAGGGRAPPQYDPQLFMKKITTERFNRDLEDILRANAPQYSTVARWCADLKVEEDSPDVTLARLVQERKRSRYISEAPEMDYTERVLSARPGDEALFKIAALNN
ncbi:hypothetical protein EVAR_54044_1 [Eumeta japonica]|uniref:Uncharacterized protein n=1 Tax=Eumeta variegata TaxID=151549 RepID=A0A4C1YTC4_EUMVA|nr:hypothetical protein EVAR_54044_1 [Eumeta japonica]